LLLSSAQDLIRGSPRRRQELSKRARELLKEQEGAISFGKDILIKDNVKDTLWIMSFIVLWKEGSDRTRIFRFLFLPF
jgi:hypothetical protein